MNGSWSWNSVRLTTQPQKVEIKPLPQPAPKPKAKAQPWASISPTSRAYKEVERDVGYYAVGMVGYAERVPVKWGDNSGSWPIKFVQGKGLGEILRKSNAEQPHHEVVVHGYVWCQSDAHAQHLKAVLDELLLGTGDDIHLRGQWRECDQPTISWGVLLTQALQVLGDGYDVMSESQKIERIQRMVYERG